MIITIRNGRESYDIQADTDSSIENTIRIMIEKGLLSLDIDRLPEKVYSVRRKRRIAIGSSYREAKIFQGDIIRIS